MRCSAADTENHSLVRLIPSLTSICSKSGAWWINSECCSSLQNPITRSTPARLYQDRSKNTISPAAGRCGTYRWKYHWVRSRSVGFSSATTRAPRGFRCSMKRLMVPPLPAASRPSKRMTCRAPVRLLQFCSLSSSICSSRFSSSYW
ncbi:Uncharacterised protein [Mycobacteroides abscessus subsp. abscessus]|nr:Uncharacterised protein [Mycobacteroides abscessus subsp. abscessus]